MSKTSCSLYPKVTVNGVEEDSILYRDLSKLIKDRKITNYIYAAYLQQEVAANMSSSGYKLNKQRQHSANDVYAFFNVARMINESIESRIDLAEKAIGARDNNGNIIKYQDGITQLEKVAVFNEQNKNLVANVIKTSSGYIIQVLRKDSETQIKKFKMKEAFEMWKTLKQVFNSVNVNLEELSKKDSMLGSIIDPTNPISFIKYLSNIKSISSQYLTKADLTLLLSLSNPTQLSRLLSKYNTIENIVDVIYDSYRGETVSSSEKLLIENTLNNCKKLQGLDLGAIQTQLTNQSDAIKTDSKSRGEEIAIDETLQELEKKYKIESDVIHLMNNKIRSLKDALSHAVVTLRRQLGEDKPDKEYFRTIKNLSKAREGKNYFFGVIEFLNIAIDEVTKIKEMYESRIPAGNPMEVVAQNSKIINDYKNLKSGYYFILESLKDIDSLIQEEGISDSDKEQIKNLASQALEIYDTLGKSISILSEETALEAFTEILGDSIPNGPAIADLIAMSQKDSTILDNVYSVARTSNPLINAMGTVIRNAQDDRDAELNKIMLRIRRATDALHKAGYDSSFMYGKDGYIISDINWGEFFKARKAYKEQLKKQSLSPEEVEELMISWVENNTELRAVDVDPDGNVLRYERVPNAIYRKEFPQLTDAQKTYYDTMMQIKGELGSMIPEVYRYHYLPPQKRRNLKDALASAKSAKDVARAFINKFKDLFTWREDDTDLGIANLDGEDLNVTIANLDNTKAKRIPIFYVGKLADQNELLKDFSGAMSLLASTAVNYKHVSKVKDTVEFMGQFISELDQSSSTTGKQDVDITEISGAKIAKDLVKIAKGSNTTALIEGFIDSHIYGIKLKDKSKLSKVMSALLKYTSIKALSLNIKGFVSNRLIGEMQTLIEAGANEFFNYKDYAWAKQHMFGNNFKAGKVVDFFNNNKNDYDVLLAELFSPVPGSFQESSHERFFKSKARKLIEQDVWLFGYSAGEKALCYTTMYAMLHHTKVLVDGEETTLYNAFTKTGPIDGNSELVLKDNVTDLDGNPINEDYLQEFKKKIRYANHSMHGAMNEEDKGIIHQRMLGRMTMSFRQWMVETYSKRLRGQYRDASTGEWREGYYRTTLRLAAGYISFLRKYDAINAVRWNEMSDKEKANVRRFRSEMVLLGILNLLGFAIGAPEDTEENFWYRLFVYEVLKTKQDLMSYNPIGMVGTVQGITERPLPVLSTINGLLYPILGLPQITETIKSGPYKGWNKYKRNVLKYTVPFWDQIEKMKRFEKDNEAFNVFEYTYKFR